MNLGYLERPDLMPKHGGKPPRMVNMNALGDALTVTNDPRSNRCLSTTPIPGGCARWQHGAARPRPRGDLFTVVHDVSSPIPPASPTLCCRRRPRPSTTTSTAATVTTISSSTGVRLLRSAKVCPTPNCSVVSRDNGLTDPCFGEDDESLIRHAFDWNHPSLAGQSFDALERDGFCV